MTTISINMHSRSAGRRRGDARIPLLQPGAGPAGGHRRNWAVLCILACIGMLGGCAATSQQDGEYLLPVESDRGPEAAERFYACREEALILDSASGAGASPAQYRAAARTIDICLTEVDANRDAVPQVDRMRLHAVGIAAYFKAGELGQALDQLHTFELLYAGQDLYLADNTSFIETFQLLLGEAPANAASRGSLVNAAEPLKSELRRKQYWAAH